MSSNTDYSDYLDSLNNAAIQAAATSSVTTSDTSSGLADMALLATTAGSSGKDYIVSLSASNKLPADYEDFINNLVGKSGASASDYDEAFKQAYYASILPGDDAETLAASLGISVTALKAQIDAQFENLYTTFAANFTYSTSTNSNDLYQTFFNQLYSYYNANSAVINSSSSLLTVYDSAGVASTITLPSYEQIYMTFFPNNSQADFQTFLNQFYTDTVNSGQTFNTSTSYGAFFDAILKEANTSSTLDAPSSVTTDQSGRTVVLSRIFSIIVEMITTLQSVAAAQADRLTIYAQWTKAYTDAMNQLPSFSAYDVSTPLRNKNLDVKEQPNKFADFGSDDDRAKVRAELNDKVVAPITERLRSYRDNVTNDSKALQSTVNQTNDAVSQQTNLATAILQELSTLLSAIYR